MSEERRVPDIGDLFVGAVRVGERGQIVIPAEVREAYGLRPGDKVLVFHTPEHAGFVVVRVHDVQRLLERFQRVLEVASTIEADEADAETPPE